MRDTAVTPVVDLGPFTLPSVFWTPAYLGPSQGLEHLPFLFWLVQAARPDSVVSVGDRSGAMYFGLCQPVLQLSLRTRCLAVLMDQDSATNRRVREYNDAQYCGFSTIANDSADALRAFQDSTVDILHIECGDEPRRLRDELGKWRSRLSERAVVVASGMGHRESGAGRFEPVGVLAPSREFHFTHSGGLLVIGAGRRPPELLRHLFDAGAREDTAAALRSMFACVGRSCAGSFLHDSVKGKLDQLLGGAPPTPDHTAGVETRTDGPGSKQCYPGELRDRYARIRCLELDGLLLRKESDDLRDQLAHVARRMEEATAELQAKLESEVSAHAGARVRCNSLMKQLEQVRCQMEEATADLQAKLESEASAHADARAQCDSLSAQLQRALDEKAALAEGASVESRKLAQARKDVATWRHRLAGMTERHAQATAELDRVMQSVSWRVTDPVRRCLHHLRRLRPWT